MSKHGDGSGSELCSKFDRYVTEDDWDMGATGDPNAPIHISIEVRYVQIIRSPIPDSATAEYEAGIADMQAQAAAEGLSLDPTEGIGDEGYLFHAGPYAGPMILRVGDHMAWIQIYDGMLSGMKPVSADDYLELARIVADRL